MNQKENIDGHIVTIPEIASHCPMPKCTGTIQEDDECVYCSDWNCPLIVFKDVTLGA